MHVFNFSPGEAEAGRFVGSRPGLSTKRVPGESRLRRESLSQKEKQRGGRQGEGEREREEEREKIKGQKKNFCSFALNLDLPGKAAVQSPEHKVCIFVFS